MAVTAIVVVFAVIGAVAVGAQLRQAVTPIVVGDAAASASGLVASPEASVAAVAPPSFGPSLAPESPSSDPSPEASSSSGIPIDSIATAVTNDLRVRSRPEVSDASTLLTPLLQKGRRVFVVDGPVAGSGYDWYQVRPLPGPDTTSDLGGYDLDEDVPFGWVAQASKEGEPWLAGGSFACPPPPTADGVGFFGTLELEGLSCLGDTPVTVRGVLLARDGGCPPGDPPIEPAWLNNSTCEVALFSIGSLAEVDVAGFDVALGPSVELPSVGNSADSPDTYDAEITGHFDDPAAQTCRRASSGNGVDAAMTADEIVLNCRATFVVTALRGIPR
jgi:hypothetical protein